LGAGGDIDRRESRNKLRSINFLFRVSDLLPAIAATKNIL
jgi:hypothetical protein